MQRTKGRPRQFDEQQALVAAMNYFWENGYDASSLSDLLTVMGIGKSSFYQAFGSKEQLFREALELYAHTSNGFIQDLREQMSEKQVLLALAQSAVDDMKATGKTKGCLVMNSGAECYRQHPQMAELIQYEYKAFHKIFTELVRAGQAAGDISNATEAAILASIYMSLVNGLVVMIKAGADDEQIESVMAHISAQLA